MLRIFSIVAIVSLLLSCAKEEDKVPANLIDRSKMRDILVQVHINEALVNVTGHHPDTAALEFKQLEAEMFKKYSIQKAQFDSSMAYYTRHSDILGEIYEEVIDTLTVMDAKKNIK